jgi:hypothetical protein
MAAPYKFLCSRCLKSISRDMARASKNLEILLKGKEKTLLST